MATAFIKKIISLYLYGTETPPANLVDDGLIRETVATTTLDTPLSSYDYMTTGAGRFAKASQFGVVAAFFNNSNTLAVNTEGYTLGEILFELGLPSSATELIINQRNYVTPFADINDYLERVLIFNNGVFAIENSSALRFYVDADGTRHIDGLKIVPQEENFDFITTTSDDQTIELNAKILPFFDPSDRLSNNEGLGRTVLMPFDDSAPEISNYYQTNFTADENDLSFNAALPHQLTTLSLPLAETLNDLWSEGITGFIDAQDRPILYGTNSGDTISADDIDPIYETGAWETSVGTDFIEDLITYKTNGVVLLGGEGDDTLKGGAWNDLLDGGNDTDTADYISEAASILITGGVSSITVSGSSVGTDTLVDIEIIKGGSGNDVFRLTDAELVSGKELHLDGGGGANLLDLSQITSSLTINKNRIEGTNITFENISVLITTNQNDVIENLQDMSIYTLDGEDIVHINDNLYILDASNIDRLAYAGSILDGGMTYSREAVWANYNNNGVSYGKNDQGDLVIRRTSDNKPPSYTYVANYHENFSDATQATAGINIIGTESSVHRLYYGLPPAWLTTNLKTLRVELEVTLKDKYESSGVDPFVLDLDGDGFDLRPNVTTSPLFDLNADGFATRTAWTLGADDGFLAIDLNENGKIDDITELFGNNIESGYAALSAYDLNSDGKVDQAEATTAEIVIWVDQDGDAQTDAGELHTLDDFSIASINVTPDITTPDVEDDYTILRQGTFTYEDTTTGTTGDIAFGTNNYVSQWLENVTITSEALALPQIKGHGTLPDLRAAMSYDLDLVDIVEDTLLDLTNPELSALRAAVMPILNGWVESVDVPSGAPGTQTRIDVPVFIEDHIGDDVTVIDFGIQRTDEFGSYWVLASGEDVLDEFDMPIARPTYSDLIAQDLGDGDWEVLTAAQIRFLERWTGEQMPLGIDHDSGTDVVTGMNNLMGILLNELNAVAVRIAMQDGPLSSFFEGLVYVPEIDRFHSTTDRQLAPFFEKIFEAAPGTSLGDAAYLDSWKATIDIVINQFDREDSSAPNSYGFIFQSLVSAYENYPLAVSLIDAAEVLDIPTDLIVTGSGALVSSEDADLFYMDGSNQQANGGEGGDTYGHRMGRR
jgi:hypothetical protein